MIKFFKRAELSCFVLAALVFIPAFFYSHYTHSDDEHGLFFNIIFALLAGAAVAGPIYIIFKLMVKSLLFTGIMELKEGEELFGETAEEEELEEFEEEPLISHTSYTELYDETERRRKLDDKRDTPDLIELYKEIEQKKLEDKRS